MGNRTTAVTGLLAVLAAVFLSCGCARAKEDVRTTSKKAGPPPELVVPVPGSGKCHTQGIAIIEESLFVSCAEKGARKAWLYRYDLPEGHLEEGAELSPPQKLDITQGGKYHPSGLDHDEECLWVAVAHYRPVLAKSKVMCIGPQTMEIRSSFEVNDHIGTLACFDNMLMLLNWDSKNIYLFEKDGRQVGKYDSPEDAAYQDCKGHDGSRTATCSAPLRSSTERGARLDRLSFKSKDDTGWVVEGKDIIRHHEVNMGREGFTFTKDYRMFLPGDFPSPMLYVYEKALLED